MKIIEECESIGHFLSLTDDQLTIGSINEMPEHLLNELKANKQLVIDSLKRDKRMKAIGATVGIPGEAYIWSLSPYSYLLLEKVNSRWELYRMNHFRGRDTTKSIASGTSFKYVYGQAKRYTSYHLEKRS